MAVRMPPRHVHSHANMAQGCQLLCKVRWHIVACRRIKHDRINNTEEQNTTGRHIHTLRLIPEGPQEQACAAHRVVVVLAMDEQQRLLHLVSLRTHGVHKELASHGSMMMGKPYCNSLS